MAISGFSGFSGWSGFSGFSGVNGSGIGIPGASGFSGYSGADGQSGFSGYSGYSGGGSYTDSYSTSETTTNKTWIDGKTIYRKVVDFGALPNNSSKGVNHNISNLERYVNYMAIAYVTAAPTGARPLSYPADPGSANNTTTMQVILGGTQVIIGTGIDRTSQSAYFILEYTKTS